MPAHGTCAERLTTSLPAVQVQLWKSTDGGATWSSLMDNDGLPEGPHGIIGVTVSPVNPDRVWAIIENENGGVYRSDDAGATWELLNSDRSLRQRAWYYTRIYADTEDANRVYVMNVAYHVSTDGGRTFEARYAPHGDHHDLWIAPDDADRLIIADDGGAQVSYDAGETWSTYMNQPTSQFYRVTTDDAFPYRVYGAQQDNSAIRIDSRSRGRFITDDNWESTAGGESAHLAPDPSDNDIVYGGSYGGFLTRFNHDLDMSRAINVWPDNPMGSGAEGMRYRFQWNFPVFFSPHNPEHLYTCSQFVHRSTNGGASWDIISPDLTRGEAEKLVSSGGPITKDNTGVEYYATVFAAAESPREPRRFGPVQTMASFTSPAMPVPRGKTSRRKACRPTPWSTALKSIRTATAAFTSQPPGTSRATTRRICTTPTTTAQLGAHSPKASTADISPASSAPTATRRVCCTPGRNSVCM